MQLRTFMVRCRMALKLELAAFLSTMVADGSKGCWRSRGHSMRVKRHHGPGGCLHRWGGGACPTCSSVFNGWHRCC